MLCWQRGLGQERKTGDRLGAGLCGDRKALLRLLNYVDLLRTSNIFKQAWMSLGLASVITANVPEA